MLKDKEKSTKRCEMDWVSGESFKAKQIVDAGIADEFGLITAEWTENEFDALCENYPVVSVIRLAK